MYRKNLVFAAACMGMLLFGIVFLSLGSVRNMLIDRFHLSASDYATLAALLPLGILTGSLIFGPVVDRFGYRWMLVGASFWSEWRSKDWHSPRVTGCCNCYSS